MTGPEHYRTAEKHLLAALNRLGDDDPDTPQWHVQAAQAHATLALAAATALEVAARWDPAAWREVAGTGGEVT